LIALPSDVMRGSDGVKGSYREVLEKLIEIFMDDLDEPQRRERALALAALCVGGSANRLSSKLAVLSA
jgi:TetR/AcrR family transcriptional repressor of nem operon